MTRHPAQPIEFSKIDEYIYIGTNMCCTFHFSKLMKMGVKADVDLEDEELERSREMDIFIWLPVKDHYPPTPDQLTVGVKFIDGLVKSRIKTYIHCQKGHGRAPTLAAAYYIVKGKDVKEAIKYVKERRPITHLSKRQVKALTAFTRTLKK